MVCLRGERLTTHRNQMNLFNAITAAAASASFIAASPASAGNGWLHAATSVKGNSIYVRLLSRSGHFVTYEEETSSSSYRSKWIANCPAWQCKSLNGTQWPDVMPGSIGAASHQTVCLANIPAFTPAARVTSNTFASCNTKVDAVFYRRHPELKGTKLISMNGSLAREWVSIQDSLC